MKLVEEALRTLFRKPFTQRYPKERPSVPPGLRGKLEHSREKCVYCGLCDRYCPSDAIEVDVKNKVWTHDLGKCLFCGQCEDVCRDMARKNAIKMTPAFELASYRKAFTRTHRGRPGSFAARR